jgi:hypothetical protein
MRVEAGQNDGVLQKLQEAMPGLSGEIYRMLMTYMVWVECGSIRYVAEIRGISEEVVSQQLKMVEALPSEVLDVFGRIFVDVERG